MPEAFKIKKLFSTAITLLGRKHVATMQIATGRRMLSTFSYQIIEIGYLDFYLNLFDVKCFYTIIDAQIPKAIVNFKAVFE